MWGQDDQRDWSGIWRPPYEIDENNLLLRHLIDEEYTRHCRMVIFLKRVGYNVNRKRVQGLNRGNADQRRLKLNVQLKLNGFLS
jgi:hypothetical protein